MKTILTLFLIIFLYLGSNTFAQTEHLKWKPLVINTKQKIWFDNSPEVDTAAGTFNIWIMQMHKPPMRMSELHGKISRSKILYGINLNTYKYGIFRVIYYDINNKEMYNFNYHLDNYPDQLKYSYPIEDNSIIKKLITILSKRNDKEKN